MTAITRKIERAGIRFVVTFDDDGVADTIQRNGKIIPASHRDARAILKHADNIRCGFLPAGFTWTERSRA